MRSEWRRWPERQQGRERGAHGARAVGADRAVRRGAPLAGAEQGAGAAAAQGEAARRAAAAARRRARRDQGRPRQGRVGPADPLARPRAVQDGEGPPDRVHETSQVDAVLDGGLAELIDAYLQHAARGRRRATAELAEFSSATPGRHSYQARPPSSRLPSTLPTQGGVGTCVGPPPPTVHQDAPPYSLLPLLTPYSSFDVWPNTTPRLVVAGLLTARWRPKKSAGGGGRRAGGGDALERSERGARLAAPATRTVLMCVNSLESPNL